MVYVRTPYVTHPLELCQYCCIHILLVILWWHEGNTASEGQILAVKSAFFYYYMSEKATSLCFKVGINHLVCNRWPESHQRLLYTCLFSVTQVFQILCSGRSKMPGNLRDRQQAHCTCGLKRVLKTVQPKLNYYLMNLQHTSKKQLQNLNF